MTPVAAVSPRPADPAPLHVFAWLWAAGMVSHMASYSEPVQPITLIMFALACAVLFGWRPMAAFYGLLLVHFVYVIDRLPGVPNHSILAAGVDLTILAVGVHGVVSARGLAVDALRVYRTFAPVLRIELLVLYFFVVFHKLNAGFFDSRFSCGAFMYLRLAGEYVFLPVGEWVRPWAIWLTILVETAIPLMLIARRTRLMGLALAFCFHFALAMDPGDVVFNFSGILLAFFFIFMPDKFATSIRAVLTTARQKWLPSGGMPPLMRTAVIVPTALLLASLIFRNAIPTGWTFEESRAVWAVYAACVLCVCIAALQLRRLEFAPARELFVVRSPALLVIPVLLVFNGVLPYLGLKTETSFAMYSNLHTENGRTNHYLIPASVQIWDYQRDLVRIQTTSVPQIRRLANRGYLWTYYEFKWLMHEHPDAAVEYEHKGVRRNVTRVSADPELAVGGALPRKFLKFRPVAGTTDQVPCLH